MVRFYIVLCYSFLFLFTFQGLFGQSIPGGVAPKELKLGVFQEFENLNPLVAQMPATHYLTGFTFRRLVGMDEKSQLFPVLLEKIPQFSSEDIRFSPSRDDEWMLVQFKLKKDIRWGDGFPLTGHDIEFSWQLALADLVDISDKQVYESIESIAVDHEDPSIFIVKYYKKHWDFARKLLSFSIVPKHLEQPVFNKFGQKPEGYERHSNYSTNPTHPGLYNGPYTVSELKIGKHVSFAPNPNYFQEKAKISNISIRLIPNFASMEANLIAQVINGVAPVGLEIEQALRLKRLIIEHKLPVSFYNVPSLTFEHLDVQLNNHILTDVKVRKALLMGLDRQTLTNRYFEGLYQPANHFLSKIDPWYSSQIDKSLSYGYSLEQAKSLLDEAGWKIGKEGGRYKNGRKLKFQILTNTGHPLREKVQRFLKEQWSALGAEVDLSKEPSRLYFGETLRKSRFKGMALYAWRILPEENPIEMFHSQSIPKSENGYSGQNFGRWSQKEIDELCSKLQNEYDAKLRQEIINEILKIYSDELPVLPLFHRSVSAIVPKVLQGFKLMGNQYAESNFSEEWLLN